MHPTYIFTCLTPYIFTCLTPYIFTCLTPDFTCQWGSYAA